MTRLLRSGFVAAAIIVGISALSVLACNGAPPPEISHSFSPSPEKPTWEYKSIAMDAGSKTEQLACLRSDDMLRFEFPYNDNYAHLCLRSDGSAIFSIASGQIMSGDNHHSRVRIGNGEPRTFDMDESSDDDSSVVFIEPAGPIFAAARAGKKIAVEATFFDAGVQTAIFSPNAPLSISPSPRRSQPKPQVPNVCANGGC